MRISFAIALWMLSDVGQAQTAKEPLELVGERRWAVQVGAGGDWLVANIVMCRATSLRLSSSLGWWSNRRG